MISKECRVSFKCPKIFYSDAALLCKYTKNHWTVHFQWVNCTVYEFYLNKTAPKKKSCREIYVKKWNCKNIFSVMTILWEYPSKRWWWNQYVSFFNHMLWVEMRERKVIVSSIPLRNKEKTKSNPLDSKE